MPDAESLEEYITHSLEKDQGSSLLPRDWMLLLAVCSGRAVEGIAESVQDPSTYSHSVGLLVPPSNRYVERILAPFVQFEGWRELSISLH